MTSAHPHRIRFRTDDLPPSERFAAWSEGIVRRRMDMEFVDLSAGGLRFTLELLPLGPVAAGLVRGTPSRFIRKPGDRDDGLSMVVSRSGRFAVVQSGERRELATGDAALFDHRRAGELTCLEEGESWSLSLPRDVLRHLLPDLDALAERVIPADDPALRLLVGYLDVLLGLDDIHEPALAGVHVADLVASLLGCRGRPEGVEEGGRRSARLRAALDIIGRAAADLALDPAGVAARLGVSVRYLHRLLQDSGRTFSEHLLAARLDRALRLLRDPRLGDRKISDIALEAGFSDLSHFNRSFRRRYGDTPSAARRTPARPGNR